MEAIFAGFLHKEAATADRPQSSLSVQAGGGGQAIRFPPAERGEI